jgi:hypothetical protein
VTDVASDKEVGTVNGVVAVPAKKSRIGRTIERSILIAKFTSFIALHHIYDYYQNEII